MEENVSAISENVLKRKGRKKLLYQKITNQMEFYFSSANLSKDRWLRQKLEEGDIYISQFMKFNRIRSMTKDLNDLVKAVKKSKILTISDDLKVKTIEPIKFKENEDEYIIYVEQVPPDADHEWLSNHFSKFGKVDYISMPKFKKNGKCKGFAFIEFAEVESALKAIEEYKTNGNYLPAATEPAELISITTFEEPNNDEKAEESKLNEETTSVSEIKTETITNELTETESNGKTKSSKKRRKSDTCEVSDEKKIKLEKLEEEQNEGNMVKSEEIDTDDPEKDVECETMPLEENEESTDQVLKEKKHKKNKSKKNKVDVYSELTILSKKDWKKLRNKYLNTQKERMSKLKKLIYLQKQTDLSKRNARISQKQETEEGKSNKANKLSFSLGLIVKGRLDVPVIEVKNFKNEMKKNKSLEFVDVKESDTVVYLRFSSSEAASEFCKNSSWPKTEILKGDEEFEYWNKIKAERAEKIAKPKKKSKGRGKNKMLKKAGKILGKHIKFD